MAKLDSWMIAEVCHEANRALQLSLNDPNIAPTPHWDETGFDMQLSSANGVDKAMEGVSPKALHIAWMDARKDQGWVYGPVKDAEKKTHPCLVPYEELAPGDRVKDKLFLAVVEALKNEEI